MQRKSQGRRCHWFGDTPTRVQPTAAMSPLAANLFRVVRCKQQLLVPVGGHERAQRVADLLHELQRSLINWGCRSKLEIASIPEGLLDSLALLRHLGRDRVARRLPQQLLRLGVFEAHRFSVEDQLRTTGRMPIGDVKRAEGTSHAWDGIGQWQGALQLTMI